MQEADTILPRSKMDKLELLDLLGKNQHRSHDWVANELGAKEMPLEMFEGSRKNSGQTIFVASDLNTARSYATEDDLRLVAEPGALPFANASRGVMIDPHRSTFVAEDNELGGDTITEEQHASWYERFVANLVENSRVLGPGGYVYGSISFAGPLHTEIETNRYPAMAKYRGEVVLTFEEFAEACKKAGLELVAVSPGSYRGRFFDLHSQNKVNHLKNKKTGSGEGDMTEKPQIKKTSQEFSQGFVATAHRKWINPLMQSVSRVFKTSPWIDAEKIQQIYDQNSDPRVRRNKLNDLLSRLQISGKDRFPFKDPDRLVYIARKIENLVEDPLPAAV